MKPAQNAAPRNGEVFLRKGCRQPELPKNFYVKRLDKHTAAVLPHDRKNPHASLQRGFLDIKHEHTSS